MMNVYKVSIENNVATSVISTKDLQHGDIGLDATKEIVQWLALECTDENEAIEVADKVMGMVWRKGAA